MPRIFAETTDVPTAGTRVQIQNTTDPIQAITFKAPSANTGLVYVEGVTAASTVGFSLRPGEAVGINFRIDNSVPISDFFVDAETSGNDVSWIAILT